MLGVIYRWSIGSLAGLSSLQTIAPTEFQAACQKFGRMHPITPQNNTFLFTDHREHENRLVKEEQTKMAISYTQLTTSEGEMQHSSHLAMVGGWILTVSIYPCCGKDNGMV